MPDTKDMTRPITSAFSMDSLLNTKQKNLMVSIKDETQDNADEGAEGRDLEEDDDDDDGKWRYSEGEEPEQPAAEAIPQNYRTPHKMDIFNHMLINSSLLHRNSIYSGHHNPNLCSLDCCRSLKAPTYDPSYGQDLAVDLKTSPNTSGAESHLAKPLLKFSVSAILGTDHRRHKPGMFKK